MNDELTWGGWIKRRMLHVGIHWQRELAEMVGCTEAQLCRLMAMESSPAQMRRGYDRSLAKALQTDAQTLFKDWRQVSPESSRLVADQFPVHFDEGAILRRKIGAVAELLPVEKLRDFFDRGETLLHSNVA